MQELGRTIFESLSGPAVRAVMNARREAGRSGADAVEPEHLLLGLLAEDQRDWEPMFRRGQLGLPQEDLPLPPPFLSAELAAKLRQHLADLAKPGVPKPDAMDMPIAQASQRILIAAYERAEPSKIGLLHLLWAMISDHENSAGDLLKSNGMSVEQVEDAIRN